MTKVKHAAEQVITIIVKATVCAIAMILGLALISYGEFMITTTGDMRWALFYVPHVVCLVWFIVRKTKRKTGR